MALNPRFAGQKLVASASPETLHTIELFLDYVCPFSKKMFDTVYTSVYPVIQSQYADKVQIVFRQQIQPWHPSSTLVHEAGAAVLRTRPDRFWAFSQALFARQTDFFDVRVVHEARNDTYARLAKIADAVGVEEKAMLALLRVGDRPGEDGGLNVGNGVTNDIKLMVKFNRRVGTHVTPTVLFNGIEETGISSSFSKEQWEEWLKKNIT